MTNKVFTDQSLEALVDNIRNYTNKQLATKANNVHTHTIADVSSLQTTLNSKANTSTLTSHTSNQSNPHGVTLTQLGITATSSELNVLDGITATTTELNYVDGVTSNIQTQLNAKSPSSHTHSNATTSADGLMSAADKTKLNGIASGANAYVLPTASSTLGGVKTTSTVTSNSGYTACPIISGVPYYKDTNTTYGTATTSANGLMGSSDKSKLDGITLATVSEVKTYLGI